MGPVAVGSLQVFKLIAFAGVALFAPLGATAATFDDAVAVQARGDLAKARELFIEAAQTGDARAQFNLGRMYLRGEGGPRDEAQALAWSGKAADQDLPGAQYDMGRIYDQGLGVRRDAHRAIAWYEKAAGRGFTDAEVRLGDIYVAGRDAPFDAKRAAELYGAAAGQGDADAKFKLAALLSKYDLGVSAITPHARFTALMDSVFGPQRWRETGGFRTAKRENELRAQGALTVAQGATSAHSVGKPEAPGAYDLVVEGLSPERAAKKLRISKAPLKVIFAEAAHGTEGPHLHVEPFSISFETGAPNDKPAAADPSKAAEIANWLRSAAAEGHPGAQLWMGRLYQRPGAPASELVLARLWFTRAASNAQADAATRKEADEALTKLGRAMTPTQLASRGPCAEKQMAACEAPQPGQ
jgi:TPR repeat protein